MFFIYKWIKVCVGGPYLLIKTKWLNTRLSTLDCRHPPCPTHRPPPLREPPDSNSVRRQKTALVPWESLHWHYHFSFKDWFLHHHQRKAQLRDLVKCKVTEEAKWSRKRARVAGRAPLCVVAAVRRSPGKQPARVKDIKDWRTPEPNWPSQGRPHPAKGGRINDCGFGIIHGKQKKKILFSWNGLEPGLPIKTHLMKILNTIELETICFEVIQFELQQKIASSHSIPF